MVGCAERNRRPSSPALRAWPRASAWIIERRGAAAQSAHAEPPRDEVHVITLQRAQLAGEHRAHPSGFSPPIRHRVDGVPRLDFPSAKAHPPGPEPSLLAVESGLPGARGTKGGGRTHAFHSNRFCALPRVFIGAIRKGTSLFAWRNTGKEYRICWTQ